MSSTTVDFNPNFILNFWLGDMRDSTQATEELWRERMLKWRVGIFARGVEDEEFLAIQHRLRAEIPISGDSPKFQSSDWDSPHGRLARLIVIDQFTRAIHRGTPLAYASDTAAAELASDICRREEDSEALNEIERLWVYVALSHPEDRKLQELSVKKWMQWSSDLTQRCPPQLKPINQKVSWFFVKSIIEHAEAILEHGRFPHRNAVLCRPYHAGELYWLTSESRPVWSYTQPPRPFYYALHTVLHRAAEVHDCHRIDHEALTKLSVALSLPEDLARRLDQVFADTNTEIVDFATLFAYITTPCKNGDLQTIESTLRIRHAVHEVSQQIFTVRDTVWPPTSSKADIVRKVNIAALVAIQQCPYLLGSPSKLSQKALQALACGPNMRSRSIDVAAKMIEKAKGQRTLPQPEVKRCLETLFVAQTMDRRLFGEILQGLEAGRVDGVPVRELVMFSLLFISGTPREKCATFLACFDLRKANILDFVSIKLATQQALLKTFMVAEIISLSALAPGTVNDLSPAFLAKDAIDGFVLSDQRSPDSPEGAPTSVGELITWIETFPLYRRLIDLSQSFECGEI